jgi:membrane-bound lytic murein transglycosylase B
LCPFVALISAGDFARLFFALFSPVCCLSLPARSPNTGGAPWRRSPATCRISSTYHSTPSDRVLDRALPGHTPPPYALQQVEVAHGRALQCSCIILRDRRRVYCAGSVSHAFVQIGAPRHSSVTSIRIAHVDPMTFRPDLPALPTFPALPARPRARFRLRTTTLGAALSIVASCMFAAAGPASAQTSGASPSPQHKPQTAQITVAQAQPQQPVQQGQTFEEEIIPQRYANNGDVDAFINDMVARYDFDANMLHDLFARVSYSATAVKLVTPAPTPAVKNWHAYQARFLDAVRINAGVKFWRANQATLQRAYEQFGVPPEVIVGIIGVETIYGRYMGNFRVLDALTTLTFDYPNTPNRAEREVTFRKNLADFLIWTRDSQIEPTSVRGSYTGAIGIPQFLPSSIIQYAVDYDGDGTIDLRTSAADAIGSVANYLKQHGWETGRPVVWNIASDAGSLGIAQAAANGQPEPHWSLEQLLRAGMLMNEPSTFNATSEAGTPVTVVDLPSPGRPTEYVLGLKNFYVLTRYNRSFFYALAVYQLGQRIKAQVAATGGIDANGTNGANSVNGAAGSNGMNNGTNGVNGRGAPAPEMQ